MPYFKCFIVITVFFLRVKASVFPILRKYGKVEDTTGMVIFESKDFHEGDNMYFKIEKNGEFKSGVHYRYYNATEEIKATSNGYYFTSYKYSSTAIIKKLHFSNVTTTNYYTIKKNSEEYINSNGDYLLLEVDCYNNINDIDFENTEKDGPSEDSIIVIIFLVVFFVIIIIIIIICCYFCRKRIRMGQEFINMIMYRAPQTMILQQGNMAYMNSGQQVMVQPNGIPYNNPNIQYSNIPNPSGLNAQNNPVPQQNYNMIPQSSAERRYNSNINNEKVKSK